jgi:hypothetical protein
MVYFFNYERQLYSSLPADKKAKLEFEIARFVSKMVEDAQNIDLTSPIM